MMDLCFLDQLHGNRYGECAGDIEQAHEIKALQIVSQAVVVVRTEQGVGIGVGLFQNRVIGHQNGKITRFQRPLGSPNRGFGVRPDLARIQVHLA